MKLADLIDRVDPSIESQIREAKKANLQAFRMGATPQKTAFPLK